MADYFTRLSVAIALPDEQAQAYALRVAGQAAEAGREQVMPDGFPADLADAIEGWDFETEADRVEGRPGLWFHSDYGGVDSLCLFIQHLLKRFSLQERVTFEWSHDCSKPRLDAYGGGAAIITADEIKAFSTWQWLADNAV